MRPAPGRVNRVEQAVQASRKRRAHRYDLHRVGRSNDSIQAFADHRSQSYRRNQVQTWSELLPMVGAAAADAVAARRARYSANTQDVPR
jgi:hypothetical protein